MKLFGILHDFIRRKHLGVLLTRGAYRKRLFKTECVHIKSSLYIYYTCLHACLIRHFMYQIKKYKS